MHPDEAVDLAIQDLRHRGAALVRRTSAPRPWAWLRALAARYLEGWLWYARDGRTPPVPEPAYPFARRRPVLAPSRPTPAVRVAAPGAAALACAPAGRAAAR